MSITEARVMDTGEPSHVSSVLPDYWAQQAALSWIRVPHPADPDLVIRMRIGLDEQGAPICTAILIERDAGALTARDLRKFPVADLLRQVAGIRVRHRRERSKDVALHPRRPAPAGELVGQVRALREMPSPVAARGIRRAAGVSRQQIADELGVHVVTVARWERGTRSPRGRMKLTYAEVLAALSRETATFPPL